MNIHDLDLRIIFQVFSQFGNIYIHTAAIEIGITAPYFFQCLLPWQADHSDVRPAFSTTHFLWEIRV